MSIRMTTLPNGLRVVTDAVESMYSAAIGIWVDVGTRHEDMQHNGVAHMVEHMLFKGTARRTAEQIATEIEDVGGSMNAYTSRELTSYHIHLLKDDVPRGMDVLADMYQNSVMPPEEIDRERQVIVQEIGMSNDTPDDLVFDLYFEKAYPGQAMGAPILGRADIIESIRPEILKSYVHQFYSPSRTVVSAAGALDHDEFVELVHNLFTALPSGQPCPELSAHYSGGETRVMKELEQAHVVLGFKGLGRLDPDYYAVQALSTLLGGGMSSRLFQEIRERRGLVYAIYAFHQGYQDGGQFCIYAGTGPDKMSEIIPVLCDEILKVGQTLSEEELGRAKAQLKANILMGRESMMSRADQHAKHLIFRGAVYDLEAQIAQINAVDLKAVAAVARRIFSGAPTLAALGPLQNLESFDKIEQRLAA